MTRATDVSKVTYTESVWDQELLREWMRLLRHAQDLYTYGTGKSGTVIQAPVRRDTPKGHYYGWGWDEAGQQYEVEARRFFDPQVESPAPGPAFEPDLEEVREEPAITQDCVATARDEGAGTSDRVLALREWMTQDGDAASSFLAEELSKANLQDEWRNSLVFAAEDASFATPDLRSRVCDGLRRIALELRMSPQPDIETVVWSALRRFGSLVDPDSIDELRDFLDPVGYVDTRLVALQAVLHIFERQPPAALDSLQRVRDRAWDIASKLLDPDVFRSGETSAVASHAVLVLCVCADERAFQGVEAIRKLGRRWIVRRLRERLRELRQSWLEHSAGVDTHPAYVCAEGVLAKLE